MRNKPRQLYRKTITILAMKKIIQRFYSIFSESKLLITSSNTFTPSESHQYRLHGTLTQCDALWSRFRATLTQRHALWLRFPGNLTQCDTLSSGFHGTLTERDGFWSRFCCTLTHWGSHWYRFCPAITLILSSTQHLILLDSWGLRRIVDNTVYTEIGMGRGSSGGATRPHATTLK
jgi:hypothetical protein